MLYGVIAHTFYDYEHWHVDCKSKYSCFSTFSFVGQVCFKPAKRGGDVFLTRAYECQTMFFLGL